MKRRILVALVVVPALILASVFSIAAAVTEYPRLVLSSYTIGDGSSDSVIPGEFTLNYKLSNTSAVDLTNAVMTYTQRNLYIVPIHGNANIEYIGKIGASREYNGTLDLYVPETVPTGIYQVDITIKYEIVDAVINSQLTCECSIYINISNNPRLDIRRIELSDDMISGGGRYLYIEYENPGISDFKDMQLIIEGNINEQQKTQALPILKAGRSNSIEYPLQFADTGIQQVDIYISYRDDAGNSYQTQVESKQAEIMDYETAEASPPVVRPQGNYVSRLLNSILKNMRSPAFLLSIIVTAAAATGIAIIIKRARKQAIRKKWYYKKSEDKNRKM